MTLAPLRALRSIFCTKSLCGLRPVPVGLQRPAVDDIADEIDGVGVVDAEKVQQPVGLRAAGSEMDVGDKQSAKAPLGALFTQGVTSHDCAPNGFL